MERAKVTFTFKSTTLASQFRSKRRSGLSTGIVGLIGQKGCGPLQGWRRQIDRFKNSTRTVQSGQLSCHLRQSDWFTLLAFVYVDEFALQRKILKCVSATVSPEREATLLREQRERNSLRELVKIDMLQLREEIIKVMRVEIDRSRNMGDSSHMCVITVKEKNKKTEPTCFDYYHRIIN